MPDPVSYVIAIGPASPDYDMVHNLSVFQCETCCALVVEDFMPEHIAWHMDTGSFKQPRGFAWPGTW